MCRACVTQLWNRVHHCCSLLLLLLLQCVRLLVSSNTTDMHTNTTLILARRCFFEASIASLAKPATMLLDLGKMPDKGLIVHYGVCLSLVGGTAQYSF